MRSTSIALPLTCNIRSLVVRWKVTLLAIGGVALAVAVMLVLVSSGVPSRS